MPPHCMNLLKATLAVLNVTALLLLKKKKRFKCFHVQKDEAGIHIMAKSQIIKTNKKWSSIKAW